MTLILSKLRILAVGKIRKRWVQEGLKSYLQRIPSITIQELKDSNKLKESEGMQALLKKNEHLIVLAEEGENLSSIDFCHRLQSLGAQPLTFAIGGADGLTTRIKESANWQFSLSKLTLPHEIARLLLVEQIYRADNISKGGAYHRE